MCVLISDLDSLPCQLLLLILKRTRISLLVLLLAACFGETTLPPGQLNFRLLLSLLLYLFLLLNLFFCLLLAPLKLALSVPLSLQSFLVSFAFD